MDMRVLSRVSEGALVCTASFPGALALGHQLCAAWLRTVAHLFPWNTLGLFQMSSQGLGALATLGGALLLPPSPLGASFLLLSFQPGYCVPWRPAGS